MIKNLAFIFIFIHASLSFANKEADTILVSIRNYDFKKSDNLIKSLDQRGLLKKLLSSYSFLVRNKGLIPYENTNKIVNQTDYYLLALYHLNLALEARYQNNNESNSYSDLLLALDYAKKEKSNVLICEIYKHLLEYHSLIFDLTDLSVTKIIQDYELYFYDDIEKKICEFYKLSIDLKNTFDDINIKQYNSFKKLNTLKIPFYKNQILIFQGNYLEYNDHLEKAFKYYQQSLNIISNNGYGYEELCRLNSYLNIGVYHYTKKQYNKSLLKLNYKSQFKGSLVSRKQVYFDYWLSRVYAKIKKYDSAYYYINKSRKKQYELNQEKHLISVNNIQEKYQNEKLRANNLEIEAKQKETRNWLIGVVLILLFTGTTAYFINKNTKRKQLLAVKEKELETQKVSTLLKEQELTSIDAMISGQEKERQRIANDLHDDLGALMATIKLHLENLEKDPQKPLGQVNLLINEAYNKIRGIAHNKNAGVMAKDGLLKALNKMASTINTSKQLQISIADYGLENRLENSLELSIFRMVQELVTNIIKHAQATEATIHLTQHHDSLNIMVEDNGIGFNPNQIDSKKGMGIHSIDKRIEHLNGEINIESAPNQGTTVIIDIPL